MVNFEEEQVQDTAETTNDLEKRIFDAAAVGKQISIMDKAEGLTKDFQTKVRETRQKVEYESEKLTRCQ